MWSDPIEADSTPLLCVLVSGALAISVLALFATLAVWAAWCSASVPDGVDAARADFEREFYAAADGGEGDAGVRSAAGGETPGCMARAGAGESGGGVAGAVDAAGSADGDGADESKILVR
ncbi:MAG: hypothetical protein QM496_01855 [Verrucomicrobiota bacterium]